MMLDPFVAARFWLIDLDDTLYPRSAGVFMAIEARILEFLRQKFQLDQSGAAALRRRLVDTHGTTLRGLMVEFNQEPAPFVDYVHDVDLSSLHPAALLNRALAALPGPKVIFTNATTKHAEAVLARLELRHHFDGIFDIEAAEWLPKPAPQSYQRVMDQYGFDVPRTAMADDAPRNLTTAKSMGLATILVAEVPPADRPPMADIVVSELGPVLAQIARL